MTSISSSMLSHSRDDMGTLLGILYRRSSSSIEIASIYNGRSATQRGGKRTAYLIEYL